MSAQGLCAGRDNVLVQGDYMAAADPSDRLPVFEVPLADRRWFWGRQDLLELLAKTWRIETTVPVTQTLAGMGSVGKSQLAAQFAYRHREEPRGGVVGVLHARSRWRTRRAGPGLRSLRCPGSSPRPSRRRRRRGPCRGGAPLARELRAALAAGFRRCLPVVSDCWSPSKVRGCVWSLPATAAGTSPPMSSTSASSTPTPLPPFSRPGPASRIPSGPGLWPWPWAAFVLALEQAGAFLARSAVSLGFADYLEALRQRGLRVFAGGRVDDYDHVVTTVWNQSFETVAALSPHAAELLELFGVLAPRPPARERPH